MSRQWCDCVTYYLVLYRFFGKLIGQRHADKCHQLQKLELGCNAESSYCISSELYLSVFLALSPFMLHMAQSLKYKRVIPKRVFFKVIMATCLHLVAGSSTTSASNDSEKLPLGDFCFEIACHQFAIPFTNHLFCVSRTQSY